MPKGGYHLLLRFRYHQCFHYHGSNSDSGPLVSCEGCDRGLVGPSVRDLDSTVDVREVHSYEPRLARQSRLRGGSAHPGLHGFIPHHHHPEFILSFSSSNWGQHSLVQRSQSWRLLLECHT